MNANVANEIAKIFAVHDGLAQTADEKRKASDIARRGFLTEFDEVAASIIYPTAVDFGEQLRKQGHDYEATLGKSREGKPGIHGSLGGVFFHFYPKPIEKDRPGVTPIPSLKFEPSYTSNVVEVTFFNCERQRAGRWYVGGQFALNEINSGVVNSQLLNLINAGLWVVSER